MKLTVSSLAIIVSVILGAIGLISFIAWRLKRPHPETERRAERRPAQNSLVLEAFAKEGRIDASNLNVLSGVFQCPLGIVGPKTIIASDPEFAERISSLPSRTLDKCTESLYRVNIRPNPASGVDAILESHGIEAISLLWHPPDPTWRVWLLFGKGFMSKGSQRVPVHQWHRFLDAVRAHAINQLAIPKLDIAQRHTRITNLRRRIAQMDNYRALTQERLEQQTEASTSTNRNSTEIVNNLIESEKNRFQRRVLGVALAISGGKMEAAARYLGIAPVSMTRLFKNLGMDKNQIRRQSGV